MSTATTTMTLRGRLESPAFADEIARVLPRHITPDRMVRVAITAMMRTPKLKDCDQASFFNAMLQLSQWGLEPDGRRAHLIPFENRKRGVIECQLILDYKGIVELALRSGNISAIHCDKVCENDVFDYDCGQVVAHKIDFRKPRGEAYAYVCIITRKDGSKKCEVMSREEVDAIRKRSRSGNNGPWVTDYDEMAKKTVFKRASKWVELSPEIRDAVEHDDRDYIDGRITDRRSSAIESTDDLTALLSKPQEEPLPAIEQAAGGEDFAARIAAADSAADLREIRREAIAADLTTEETDEVLALISERVDVLDPQ